MEIIPEPPVLDRGRCPPEVQKSQSLISSELLEQAILRLFLCKITHRFQILIFIAEAELLKSRGSNGNVGRSFIMPRRAVVLKVLESNYQCMINGG